MKKFLSKQDGFTLVELMVVVAIIGVLSAVAVPNFKKYQAKSKTSEAKLQLSAAYTAQQSFYSDYDTYHTCLKYMGFNPTNEIAQRIYAVGIGVNAPAAATTIATQNGAIVADDATSCYATGTTGSGETFFPAGKTTGSAAALLTVIGSGAPGAVPDANNFTIGAVGVVDINFATLATASTFSINQAKRLIQVRAGY